MMHPEKSRLLAHVDGELPSHEANEIAGHIAVCTACARSVAELRGTSELFGMALAYIDRLEPASWGGGSAVAAADVIPLRPRRRRAAYGGGVRMLRRAALFLLATAAAASAAVLVDRAMQSLSTERTAAPAVQAPTAPVETAVSVAPTGGRVEVALSGVAVGTRVRVVVEDREDARVVIQGATAPHFTAAAGRVAVQLSDASAVEVQILVPLGLASGRVTADGETIIDIDAGAVTPAAALGEGVLIGTAPTRDE